MKRLLIELGGKGACIVFDDADLKTAITGITSVWGFHSGQICTAPTRVLAQRGIYDQLVEGLKGAAGLMKVGDPLAADTVLGPVITGAHRDRVEGYIAAGRDEGGTIVAGGERPDVDGKGFFVAPTLIADCKPGMKVVQEEIFGPVVVVVPFDDAGRGRRRSPTAPSSACTTTCSRRTRPRPTTSRSSCAPATSASTPCSATTRLPFGGFKMSGVGRDGGKFGFHAYSELQSIVWPG